MSLYCTVLYLTIADEDVECIALHGDVWRLCDIRLLLLCPEGVDRLSFEEHGAIYYVCGYICKKEGIIGTFDHSQFRTEHCQFTTSMHY